MNLFWCVFQIREMETEHLDSDMCQLAAMCLKNLSSIRFSSSHSQAREFDVENAVKCLEGLTSNGKLRSVSFEISTSEADLGSARITSQKLLLHPSVKNWSKVIRVRCDLKLVVDYSSLLLGYIGWLWLINQFVDFDGFLARNFLGWCTYVYFGIWFNDNFKTLGKTISIY